jgi:hypothetical protein
LASLALSRGRSLCWPSSSSPTDSWWPHCPSFHLLDGGSPAGPASPSTGCSCPY